MKKIINSIGLILFVSVILIQACETTEETFSEFTERGETIYVGKPDSVFSAPGFERLRFFVAINADPKISNGLLISTDGSVSYKFDVVRARNGSDTITFDVDLPEGEYNFKVTLMDDNGNKSIPTEVRAVVYGSKYEATLLNRGIEESGYVAPDYKDVSIIWSTANSESGLMGVELTYFDTLDVSHELFIQPDENETLLEGFKPGASFEYRTLFKPATLSLDTFRTKPRSVLLPQLKNRKVPFIASEATGRWGILADWISNDAVKNHGGYGGWDEWDGNILNTESGWGSGDITNGKIYQTFTLSPATYTFEIVEIKATNISYGDPVYVVAAVGDSIPDVEQLGTSLAYTHVFDKKITFKIEEETQVSLGCLTSQQGDKYFKISAFNFFGE